MIRTYSRYEVDYQGESYEALLCPDNKGNPSYWILDPDNKNERMHLHALEPKRLIMGFIG